MTVPNFRQSREDMVMRYMKRGYLWTPRLAESMRRGPRELFVEPHFSHLVYSDRPIPISHSKGDWPPQAYQHSLFYEPLDLQKGDSFLEMGTDSGYGATQGLLVKKIRTALPFSPENIEDTLLPTG